MNRLPRARKRFGQNFLTNTGVINKISQKIEKLAGGEVLEIGPGRGGLTAAMLGAGVRVTAVEIDRDLVAFLRERFRENRFRLESGDILEIRFGDLLETLDPPPAGRFLVVGNLPYNISKPIVQKLILERESVAGAVLMFQKEVAARLTAVPKSRNYGPFGIFAGTFFRIESWFDLAPGSFRPSPKVTSTVTIWTRKENPDPVPEFEQKLKICLAVCFRYRRQTLYNNLRRGLPGGEPSAKEVLAISGLDGSDRAENLPPESFHALASVLQDHLP